MTLSHDFRPLRRGDACDVIIEITANQQSLVAIKNVNANAFKRSFIRYKLPPNVQERFLNHVYSIEHSKFSKEFIEGSPSRPALSFTAYLRPIPKIDNISSPVRDLCASRGPVIYRNLRMNSIGHEYGEYAMKHIQWLRLDQKIERKPDHEPDLSFSPLAGQKCHQVTL